MDELVPPSRQALREALALSDEILRNLELSEIPLANVALKTSRLARLLNDLSHQKIMEYEASGYPTTPGGVPSEAFQLAVQAGREFQQKDAKTEEVKSYIFRTSIEALEQDVQSFEVALAAARDPDVSISSANPHQHVYNPSGNHQERRALRTTAASARERLSSRRSFIYSYVLKRHHELKFSGIADDIFSRIRETVDTSIGAKVPEAAQMLTAVYDNLQSDNSEDWSNAVHSCRRILQALADAIYPAAEDKTAQINGKPKTVKLGADNYVNRLVAFLEERTDSERFQEIVGSHLGFMGERLDSVFRAAQKGSHSTIVSQAEADRYVVYTYLIVGDILTLL
jgi:hypothetical protein